MKTFVFTIMFTLSASVALGAPSQVLVSCSEKYSSEGLTVEVTQDSKGYITGTIKKDFPRNGSESFIKANFLRKLDRVGGITTYSSFDDGRFYLTQYADKTVGDLTYIYAQHQQDTVQLICR
ncbi:MAG: hypothetical protein AB7F59_00820 [Bdellovibrionales bacterium]